MIVIIKISGIMIKCPNCSGELSIDVSSHKVVCDYCGSTFDPKELRAKVQVAGEHKEYSPIESGGGSSGGSSSGSGGGHSF